MAEQLTPDLCIIGAGSAGLSMAAAAAALGAPVVLIEKGRMGGECLNTGCVPSKALIAAASAARAFAPARRSGSSRRVRRSSSTRSTTTFTASSARLHPTIPRSASPVSACASIEGEARFRDTRTVVVGQESDVKFEIKARRFVIATGSLPAIPPIPGLDGAVSHQRDRLRTRERPKHLIVIGGGPIGMELAQAFRRLGSEVTVLDAAQPLAKEDPECAAVVLDALAREGVTVRSDVKIARVRRVRSRIEVVLAGDTEETIQGSDSWWRPAGGRTSRPRPGCRPHQARTPGHRGQQALRHQQQARLCHRRRDRPGAVHPRRQFAGRLMIRHLLFRLPVRMNADDDPARHLHRSRTGPCRPDRRGRRGQAIQDDPGAALALPRERPRPGRARNPRPYQGGDRQEGNDPGRNHRRRCCRRADHGLDAGRQPWPQYPCFCRNRGALSDFMRKSASARRSAFSRRV
jgi:hypothetical protein